MIIVTKGEIGSALLWDIPQRWMVVLYRRFGTETLFLDFTLEDGTDRLSRNVGTELSSNAA
jgi:hypothetical protein